MNLFPVRDLVILVVCSNRDVLEVIERLLGHLEINVTCVMSTDAALVMLQTETYSAMISDHKMKDFNGREFSRTVRQLFPALNVVLFEGNTSSQVMDLFLGPEVSEISEVQNQACSLGDMLMSILRGERGKTFLLRQTSTR
ncbi:response regulator [Geotalea daltonii FRC-32]|uniref:Response regulator n=1 Tax=Geotalea daltonii (strain DSM 22248 / JCM 15807 / FRC-32) TaxID=316067 RepID=B9M0Q5_GEODF|nr:response regulator [Geotalea daltonii FRC-32]